MKAQSSNDPRYARGLVFFLLLSTFLCLWLYTQSVLEPNTPYSESWEAYLTLSILSASTALSLLEVGMPHASVKKLIITLLFLTGCNLAMAAALNSYMVQSKYKTTAFMAIILALGAMLWLKKLRQLFHMITHQEPVDSVSSSS